MHHLYPSGKGDSLCPLGFHPQVRWPTRCKRCFRDYKEHGGRKNGKDDIAASSPSLSSWNSQPQITHAADTNSIDKGVRRSWASSSNLFKEDLDSDDTKLENLKRKTPLANSNAEATNYYLNRPASWTSTPDLGKLKEDTCSSIPTVSITLPRKRPTTFPLAVDDTGQKTEYTSPEKYKPTKTDNILIKTKKLKDTSTLAEKNERRIKVKEMKPTVEETSNNDVQFLIQVKSKTYNKGEYNKDTKRHLPKSDQSSDDDSYSVAGTETTDDTTLVDKNEQQDNDLQDQIESLKKELETVKLRCEKAEREKSDMLLRRLATYETTSSKTTATEVLKLQQKCNELQTQLEDVRDDKKSFNLRVKELENELENRPNHQEVQKSMDELKSKLIAAETLCEELMDENEDMKKEMRELEEEMEEMQDNFREDQADEYTSLKKELEQTTKNCRILSFKLRKTERKVEQLESEKQETEKKLKDVSGGQSIFENIEKIKRLEQDLNVANEVSIRLQKEVEETNAKLKIVEEAATVNSKPKFGIKDTIVKKKAPSLGTISKLSTGDKVSRESLTRGGSQDDPVQLLRDLQDCLEREADLREQLKFAEEEAQNLRKKASRVEDDNESLVMQLKKMATKARGRKLSPSSTTRLIPSDASMENDEGISEDDDPSELRLLLELSEQESSVLRRKIEDMELEAETTKRKLKDTQTKLAAKLTVQRKTSSVLGSVHETKTNIHDQKMKVMEDETNDLRKKLIEKERDCERLYAELSLTQKRTKGMQKSKSLDGDQQTLDLKRQLQVIEQETSVLQTKLQTLETENEQLSIENKRLSLLNSRGIKKSNTDVSKAENNGENITKQLETQLSSAKETIKEITEKEAESSTELNKLKQQISSVEIENAILKENIARMQTSAESILKSRTSKKPTELTTKLHLRNMVLDLENEIGSIIVNLKNSEDAKSKLEKELKQISETKKPDEKPKSSKELIETKKQIKILEKQINEQNLLIGKEKTKYEEINTKFINTQDNIKKLEEEKTEIQKLIKKIENENSKLTEEQKKANKLMSDKEKKISSLEKDLELVQKKEKDVTKTAEQINEKNKTIQENEKRLLELEEKIKTSEKLLDTNKEKITKLEKQKEQSTRGETKLAEELAVTKSNLSETKNNLENTIRDKSVLEDKVQKFEIELKNEKKAWENKASDLESDLLMERKKVERMKANYEKQQKNQQQELMSLKLKIQNLECGSTIIDSHKMANKELTNELAKTKQQYEDLTSKYELLEEEHVGTKAQLVLEKEAVTNQLTSCEKELTKAREERNLLSQTHMELQEQIKELRKNSQQVTDIEKGRLKSAETRLEEKCHELDVVKRETEVLEDQFKNLRKENDDLKQKLDDFAKVTKIQRSINADNTALDKELAQMKTKLTQSEKIHRADVVECKMRYESQIKIVSEELQSLQNQVMKFKRERDMFKHMLEGTQKALGELKSASSKPSYVHPTSASHNDEMEETKSKMATLEQQVSCLEDELSEARLERTKIKTELVSERSSWEVKLSEMRSRVNELEEERLLTSGRTKIVGIRTRMELAWQKEREEQQRLLQETSTLARDLRQTLFEVERERDKERLEARRKQEQLKKTAEEEQEENRKKLNELQCDLLELRDAHAKLRTTNEKLRREKERNEKEKDELRTNISNKKKVDQDDEKRVNVLLDQVEKLLKMVPESRESSRATTPTPPKRTRSKSRESSPSLVGTTGNSRRSIEREIQYSIQKLKDTMQDARQDKARMKIRRAASTEQDVQPRSTKEGNGGLNRRSLSLEPGNSGVSSLGDVQSSIWSRSGNDSDSLSSLQSLDKMSTETDRYYSMDSRLSGGSTQSEVITNVEMKKKKKGIMGTLKKLTKSRSVEDQSGSGFYKHGGGSDSSVGTEENHSSKIDLKDRITGIFRRSGSSSRSNSMERKAQDSSSLQRPVKFSTQSRPSPTPSDASISSRNADIKLSQSRPSPSPSETSITARNANIKLSSQSRSIPSSSESSITMKRSLNTKYKK